jgi:hypothetical protein
MVLRHSVHDHSGEAKGNDCGGPGRRRGLPMHDATRWEKCANEKGVKAHFTGYHESLFQKDWTAPRCKLIQRFELMGEGEIDENADVIEIREGGVK